MILVNETVELSYFQASLILFFADVGARNGRLWSGSPNADSR
jgi:hypothetical protein